MKWSKRILLILLLLALGTVIFFRAGKLPDNFSDAAPAPTAEPEPTPLVFETPPVELRAVLTPLQLKTLDTSFLRRLDLTGSSCYAEIEQFIEAHPNVEVVYAVILTGDGDSMSVAPDAKGLRIEDASLIPSLISLREHLPVLSVIEIEDDIAEDADVDALGAAYPEAEINYYRHLLNERYPYDTEELTLTGMNAESLRALLPELAPFTHLKDVNLPQEDNELSLAEAATLSEAFPQLRLHYQVEMFGQTVSLDTDRLEYENTEIGPDGLAEIRDMLPYLSNLNYLKLDNCGIDNETMAQLRDEFPQIEVVWRVYFGNYHCLTDTEMIWATGSSVNDNNVGVLKYCTKVKYLDLGHTIISKIDFVREMPDLEVVILANSWVDNIQPISACSKLEYIELFSTCVTDFSPLAACTHLQHLNISHSVDRNYNRITSYIDISSLYDLPEIKRFYCTMCDVTQAQKDEIKARHPDCEFDFSWEDPAEGRWRFEADGKTYNERYALLREQFGYDTLQQSGKTWSLYG